MAAVERLMCHGIRSGLNSFTKDSALHRFSRQYCLSKYLQFHQFHYACGTGPVRPKNINSGCSPIFKTYEKQNFLTIDLGIKCHGAICRSIVQKTSSKREEKFKAKDGIPPSYDLIYKAPMDIFVFVAKGISSVSMLLLLGVGIYKCVMVNGDFPSISTFGDMIENNEQLTILITALFLANFGVHNVVSNYPLRIYHNDGMYISIFTGKTGFPFITKTLEFKRGDVKHVNSQSILPWQDSIYLIGRKKVFLLEDFFRTPADLTSMMMK